MKEKILKQYPLIDNYIRASDVNTRNGIGLEIYIQEKLVLEIFRDDSRKTRELTSYRENLSLELIDQSITLFKEVIEWYFIDSNEY